MTGDDVRRLGEELGLDAVGVARAEAYDETERHHRRAPRARPVRRDEVHDGAARSLVPSGDAPARGAHRRLGGALLLAARGAARARPGPSRALHLGRRLRRAAREARRARRAPRRDVSRARRREPARRPRGRGAERGRLLRQEHDADHAPPRLVGRARDARHRRRARRRRRRSTPTAATAASASTPARPARSTSRARSTRPAASRTGRRRRTPSRSPTAPSSARRSTAATSARTSARGTAASRSAAATCEPTDAGHVDLVAGSRATARRSSPSTTASTCRATTRAGSAGTRSSRSATSATPSDEPLLERFATDDDELLAEHATWALAQRAGANP